MGVFKRVQVVDPELAQVVRDETKVGIQRVLSYQRDDSPRDQYGEKDGSPKPVAQGRGHLPVYSEGEAKAHDNVQDHAGDRELGSHKKGFPRHPVVEEVPVVPQPDKDWWVQEVIIEQAEHYGPDQGAGDEAEKEQQG